MDATRYCECMCRAFEPSTERPLTGRSSEVDDEDFEGAGAVDALDSVEFDVAGGGGAADPGLRAGRVEALERCG
jgi:hypothetical protein